jgi:hypothetical protein
VKLPWGKPRGLLVNVDLRDFWSHRTVNQNGTESGTCENTNSRFVRLRFSRLVVLGLASWKQIPPAASHRLVAPRARDIRPVPDLGSFPHLRKPIR